MSTNNLTFDYDKKHDILYISVGDPRPSYSDEILPGVFLRRDLDTDEISGVTILKFCEQLSSKPSIFKDIPIDLSETNLESYMQFN